MNGAAVGLRVVRRSRSALVVALTGLPDIRLPARAYVDVVGDDLPA